VYTPTPEDFDALVREAKARHIDPLDVAVVLYFESAGFDPASLRKRKDGTFLVGGLNQMSAENLRAYGIEQATWLAMSAAEQLPTIFRFWDSLARGFAGGTFPTDEAQLEAINFAPKRYKDSHAVDDPHAVLITAADGRTYSDNLSLDPKRTGEISLDTIRDTFAAITTSSEPRWLLVRDGVRDAIVRSGSAPTPGPRPPPPSPPKSKTSKALAVVALGGVLAWLATRGRTLLIAAAAAAAHGAC
jgi:hypothetical protein